MGSIQLNYENHKAAVKTGEKKERYIHITGLKYKYSLCVEPKFVKFEAFELKNGYCDLKKRLNLEALKISPPEAQESKEQDVEIKIDLSKASSLGAAYSSSGGTVALEWCVRARMVETDTDILFTENNFIAKYSIGKFELKMTVDQSPNTKLGNENDIMEVFPITVYQCDTNYNEITTPKPITPKDPFLRMCIAGKSDDVVCKKILSATLKQSGNEGMKDNKFITNSEHAPDFKKYGHEDMQKGVCKLEVHLRAGYFRKTESDSKLQLTVEGNADMQNKAGRRQLSDADNQHPDKQFQIFFEIQEAETGDEPHSTTSKKDTAAGGYNLVVTDGKPQSATSESQSATTWVMGKEVDKRDTATGIYNLAIGAAMIVFMLV